MCPTSVGSTRTRQTTSARWLDGMRSSSAPRKTVRFSSFESCMGRCFQSCTCRHCRTTRGAVTEGDRTVAQLLGPTGRRSRGAAKAPPQLMDGSRSPSILRETRKAIDFTLQLMNACDARFFLAQKAAVCTLPKRDFEILPGIDVRLGRHDDLVADVTARAAALRTRRRTLGRLRSPNGDTTAKADEIAVGRHQLLGETYWCSMTGANLLQPPRILQGRHPAVQRRPSDDNTYGRDYRPRDAFRVLDLTATVRAFRTVQREDARPADLAGTLGPCGR